ncbi:reverse transcriptase domain-containing protein [Citrus sinensis]|uniref:Reverse transcriptase domain-containing protein n=1 Tax=Citrus sinensis TaxID=2711 RepID=A0ACB8MKS4_CITSI|nr:reverse transcriptase domain-containing protein [Citrus sinensis]
MRIRVSLDVRKPLKRRMKLKKIGSEWIWIDFKYERLHVFCFICGLLGHTEKQCPSLYDCHASTITKPYGQWMKAPTRRNNMNSGEKWLCSVPPEMGEGKYGNCMESADDMSIDSVHPIKSGIANLRSTEGGEKDRSVLLNKTSNLLVPAKSQLTSKGKEVIGTGPTKKGEEDFELGLVVVENKRRRSKLELEENPPNWKLRGFREAVADAGLVDLGMAGYPFTWERSRSAEEWVEERLDRALANTAWCNLFPQAKVWSLEATCSDHLPIFVDQNPSGFIHRHTRFRFENVWLRESDCEAVVQRSWSSSAGFPIQHKLAVCGGDLWIWGGKLFRDFCKRIVDCKQQMAILRGRRDQEGLEAFTEGMWYSRPSEIDALIVEYFQTLFSSESCICEPVLACVEASITALHNQLLLEPFTTLDVKEALFSMHPDKSPGPDGMNPAFYQKFWHVVGKDVTEACLSYITNRAFPEKFNDTLIVLIPKHTQPEQLTDMRPIALCNVLYKIVAKMLANRMKLVLGEVISDSQSAFVPGRAITDNILISTEIIHYLKRKKQGKARTAALKIDMSKAYNRVEWSFLKLMMLRMGFDEGWVELVMMCVSTVRYKVLRNGVEVGPIVPSRGLRQGDPLSPYLFIICAEGLSSLIRNRERAGLIHGVKVARRAPAVSHLFFADDCFLFFKAQHNEARIMKSILAVYGAASGQKVNLNKSSISFSANMGEESIRQVCGILEVPATNNHGTYLGLPSQIGKKKSVVFNFIKEKVWQQLQGWSQKFLSRAGKEIMLKTVAQAGPNYAMNIYLLPLDLCNDLEIMMNSYWWGSTRTGGKGIHWLRWDKMCKSKSVGGIGFKRIHDFNIAMLGKQCWRLMTNPLSLVARILKARYYPKVSLVNASVGFNPSYTWRSIMAAKDVVVNGSRIRIGNGQQVQLSKDPWLPDANNGFITSELDESLATATVDSLMVPGQRRWDYDLIADVFNSRDAALILQVPLSVRQDDDCWYWLADPKGQFTVRSCYNLLNSEANVTSSRVWKRLWGLEVPGKVKHFFWCALMNVLPTVDNLRPRKVEVSPICPICNAENESVLHCLVECLFAQSCWVLSSIGTFGSCSSLFDWFEQVFTRCCKDDCNLAVMLCWRLWFNRNDKVWNNHGSQAQSLVNAAGHCLFQWQEAKRRTFTIAEDILLGHGSVCWGKPPVGWLKCNVDAGVSRSQGRVSFGGVIRDSGGDFIAAKCQSFPGSFHPREAEALAVREALSWIKLMQLSKIIIETDCLNVYSALLSPSTSSNGFGLLIADCRAIAQVIGEVRFSFVRRSANAAAHSVARVGGSMSGPREWRVVPPLWLCPLLTDPLV